MAEKEIRGRTDRLLVAEVVLAAIFIVMLFALYLVPAVTEQPYRPGLWRWIALAIPFFGGLYLESKRRRLQQRAAVRSVVRGEAAPAEAPPPMAEPPEEGHPPAR